MYGNIALWHKGPPPNGENKHERKPKIDNWYFLFPDAEIYCERTARWHKGIAIPLSHGTVILWDARLLRHCTAWPILKKKVDKQGNFTGYKSSAYGTYFGINLKVENKMIQELEEKRAAKKARMV